MEFPGQSDLFIFARYVFVRNLEASFGFKGAASCPRARNQKKSAENKKKKVNFGNYNNAWVCCNLRNISTAYFILNQEANFGFKG